FQAEDGIRAFHVTGVQTCALPISSAAGHGHRAVVAWYTEAAGEPAVRLAHSADAGDTFGAPLVLDAGPAVLGRVAVALDGGQAEIGRASCRGSVAGQGVAGFVGKT